MCAETEVTYDSTTTKEVAAWELAAVFARKELERATL
jgi:hypothetical protein